MKAPRIVLVDTGLAAHLVGLDAAGLIANTELWGAFVETFVAMELLKQAGWSRIQPALYHFRTSTVEKVDVVLESPSGEIVGVEVKATVSLTQDDFRGLRTLGEIAGRRFLRGILLYLGDQAVPFAANLLALPLPSLWHSHEQTSASVARAGARTRQTGAGRARRR